MPKLKPCPFCGKDAEVQGHVAYQVYCTHCSTVQMGVFFKTKDEAIDAWNNRWEDKW